MLGWLLQSANPKEGNFYGNKNSAKGTIKLLK
jgi:hypothetical protein